MPREYKPKEWLEQIEHGLEYRRKFGLEDLWSTFEAIYYNTHESMLNDGPNIFLSQGDAMLSTLLVPSPRLRVKPTKPEEVATAPLVESIDNALLRDLDIASEVDSATLHAYLFGRGILKVGYDSEWGYDPTYDIAGDLQLGLTLTQVSGKRRIEYDSTISPGSPWVRSVMPHDIVVPWGTKELDSTPWIAHRFVRHIDDLKADPKYSVPVNLQPTISMEDFVNSYRRTNRLRHSRINTRKPEFVEMWEIHDRARAKIYVVTSGQERFLRSDDNVLQIENRLPFVSVAFTPRTRAFWTTPDVYYLYHIQSELSDVARQRTKQRRLSTVKFLYDEGVIDEEELAKMLSPDVGAAGKINSGHDITRAIYRIDNTPDQTLALEENLLRANAREQIGFSRNQLGEYTPGRKTATEASVVERASQLRMSRRGLLMKRLYEDLFRTINGIVFSFWTLPRYVSVLGQERAEEWVSVSGQSLKGRYTYEVEFTEEGQMQARKLEALQLYAALSRDPSVNPQELREFLISQLGDPALERVFSAPIQPQMPVVPTQVGGVGALSELPASQPRRRGPSAVAPMPNGVQRPPTQTPQ